MSGSKYNKVMAWVKIVLPVSLLTFLPMAVDAQYNNSGISAGFFDSSEGATINFSTFHLPPLAVLNENADLMFFWNKNLKEKDIRYLNPFMPLDNMDTVASNLAKCFEYCGVSLEEAKAACQK